MKSCSVIIPTHNRKRILSKSLTALFDQTYPAEGYEIIVADDGSNDGTEELLGSLAPPCSIRYLRLEKMGAARARNRAIEEARGSVILFIDDDTVATRRFMEDHLKIHEAREKAIVQGPVLTTHDIERPDRLRLNMVDIYQNLKDLHPCFFPAGNVSVRKEHIVKAGLFDEEFSGYGWEDMELGKRLLKLGLKSVRCYFRCIAFHYKEEFKPEDLTAIRRRERDKGFSSALYYSKLPTLETRLAIRHSSLYYFLDRFISAGGWLDNDAGEKVIRYLYRWKRRILLRIALNTYTYHHYMVALRQALGGSER